MATYLPPGFVVPDPPEPLPPGVSIDSTSSDSEREGKSATRKIKRAGPASAPKTVRDGVVDENESDSEEADDENEGDSRDGGSINVKKRVDEVCSFISSRHRNN
jgi:hypothetical protein